MRHAFSTPVELGFALPGGHDAILSGIGAGHVLDAQHTGVLRHGDVHQLLHGGRAGVDQIVREQDGEGLVAHRGSGRQHRVAQPQRSRLPDIEAIHVRG
ncbi:hypothetical protein D3C72_1965840 [compost metagenome]